MNSDFKDRKSLNMQSELDLDGDNNARSSCIWRNFVMTDWTHNTAKNVKTVFYSVFLWIA